LELSFGGAKSVLAGLNEIQPFVSRIEPLGIIHKPADVPDKIGSFVFNVMFDPHLGVNLSQACRQAVGIMPT